MGEEPRNLMNLMTFDHRALQDRGSYEELDRRQT